MAVGNHQHQETTLNKAITYKSPASVTDTRSQWRRKPIQKDGCIRTALSVPEAASRTQEGLATIRPRNQRSFCTLQAGKGESEQPHCPSNESPSAPCSLDPYIGHRGLELWAEFETLALSVSDLVSHTTATGRGCQSRSPVLCCASS